MIALTTVAIAKTFVGKRINYRKQGWRVSSEGVSLSIRGDRHLVIRNNQDVEVGLHIRGDDPWMVEVANV